MLFATKGDLTEHYELNIGGLRFCRLFISKITEIIISPEIPSLILTDKNESADQDQLKETFLLVLKQKLLHKIHLMQIMLGQEILMMPI